MKLVRLVTDDSTSVFDNTFNDSLTLSPNSKIALQSLSIDTVNDVIVIDASNSLVQFQVSTGFVTSVNLTYGSYNKDNYVNLLNDIQNKMNAATGFTLGTNEIRRNLGLEWRAQINSKTQTSIAYNVGASAQYPAEWDYTAGKVENFTAQGRQVWGQTAGQPNDLNNDRSMLFPKFISRGCGYLRCRTHRYEAGLGAGALREGYLLALSKTDLSNVDPANLTNADISYGIAVTHNVAGDRVYQKVTDGAYSFIAGAPTPNFIDVGNVNNDFQEITINYDKIDFNVYQNGSNVPTLLYQLDYPAGEKLYPLIVFRGGNLTLNSVRVTPSPYDIASLSSLPLPTDFLSLGAPPQQQVNKSDNFLQLSPSLAEFFGYNTPRIPQNGFYNVAVQDYIGDVPFEPSEIADAFLVELLNLKCESYDGLLNQRKNILYVIPKSNKDGELIYEVNNPIFIDLNNAKDVLLRNIRLRVVRPDYSVLEMRGQATMVLLVDG